MNFVAGSSNKLQKIEFGTKKSVESSMCLITLGPMAQATLILIMFRNNPKNLLGFLLFTMGMGCLV
jgi:hypothetical protein